MKDCNLRNSLNECPINEYKKCEDVPEKFCYPDTSIPDTSPRVEEVKIKDFGNISFGKYKGQLWMKVAQDDPDYINFLISEKCNIREQYKKTAREVQAQAGLNEGQLEMPDWRS